MNIKWASKTIFIISHQSYQLGSMAYLAIWGWIGRANQLVTLKANYENCFWCQFYIHICQDFQKSALPTLFKYARVRAAHQSHVWYEASEKLYWNLFQRTSLDFFLESEQKLLELPQLWWQLPRTLKSLYLLMRQLRLYLVQIAVFQRPDVSDSYIIGHHRHNEIWKQNEKMQRSVNFFLLKVPEKSK